MPSLIVIGLHPVEPVDAATFTGFLTGLTIDAFDLTFADSTNGVAIGSASGLADPHLSSTTNNNVTISSKSVLQHYKDVPDPMNPTAMIRVLEAAATAVIVLNAPAGHPEYPGNESVDIRLKITRGGMNLFNHALDYNVIVTTVASLSTNQKNYFAMTPSAYVALPSANVGLDPALAYVDMPANGQPPRFDDLVKAIDLVLAKDPGGANAALKDRPPLTPAQSRHVAAEIVWNRVLYPPPSPPRSLGDLYTWPPADPNPGPSKDDIDRDRARFEAERAGYRATHDADALRLAGFVYAACIAVACEKRSAAANSVGFGFPLLTGATPPPQASAAITGALNSAFVVPAAFFYALGAALPMQVEEQQRYDLARMEREPRLLEAIQSAIDAGVIGASAPPLSIVPAPNINRDQAVRRLHALGSAQGQVTQIGFTAPIAVVVTDWLAHAGPSAAMDTAFWIPEAVAQPAAYLELVLHIVTGSHAPLMTALKGPPFNITSMAGLLAIDAQQWRDFFNGPPPKTALLPPFTLPGTPAERAEAFIRHLQKFFAVPAPPSLPMALNVSAPPTLGTPVDDVLKAFADAYLIRAGIAFSFGAALNVGARDQAIADVFPSDAQARAWLTQTLDAIDSLFLLTDIGFVELRFSLMEALYARGFTAPQDLAGLSLNEFQDALVGTVAYPHAAAIYAKAGVAPPNPPPASQGFQPINPDGELVNCIPPPHLSPFGPVAYLAEMLRLTAESSCQSLAPPLRGSPPSLANLLALRRGPLHTLHATRANLEVPLPMIDLVNESLELVADALPAASGGAVYDTADNELAGHKLRGAGHAATGEPFRHDPATLFAALPEHSSPATPVEKPGAYSKLARDFSSPHLPYSQTLDVNRSYLRALGTTRFSTMRTFRRDITEFVLDPANEPADFQRHLWRYPVRLPIALEYLQISPAEFALLYSQDIVTAPAPDTLLLRDLYGFAADVVDGSPWLDLVLAVPEFIARTGLTYCEFLELWRSGFVAFKRAGADPEFPECLPCCPDSLRIDFAPLDPLVALRKLAVFIRLWRSLRQLKGTKISWAQLRDICEVLRLFNADAINPEFLRELAGLWMLRDFMRLPLSDAENPTPAASGAERTHLLALWAGPASTRWDWAVALLLEHIDAHAEQRYPELRRAPELIKILAENLDALSRLAGFDPTSGADTWHARPTSTLRFVEVLTKIYTSGFTVGDILFLFTPEAHLAGDDPFRLPDGNEALEDPLDVVEDDDDHNLWNLRAKLLAASIDDDAAEQWTWPAIVAALVEEFGFTLPGPPDFLTSFASHFFPSVLEAAGQPVALAARQYRLNLAAAATAPLMWNTPPNGPFRYDPAAQQLWTQLPVRDDAVIEALHEMRPLNATEQAAVRDLYFAPRVQIAQLAFMFGNLSEALDALLHERDEAARWRYFRREFALFHERCRIIAAHLAEHVTAQTSVENSEGNAVAWKILRHLRADENFAQTPWENDSGVPPNVTWGPQPHGGAFAALLGVTGTGLLTELRAQGATLWRDTSGTLSAFGELRNEWNTPVPVILPALDFPLAPEQQRFVIVRNGVALRDTTGEPLGGAQPFSVSWSGMLLVEEAGQYRFHAGAPTPQGEQPDFAGACEHRWRLTLKRGQKSWILLNRGWPGEDAPDSASGVLALRRGAYRITVELEQEQPTFATAEEIRRRRCGFEIKYAGPDTDGKLQTIPATRLFRDAKSQPLGADLRVAGTASNYLSLSYTSTLRDIRRTYQRAFKAVLFAHRFALSAKAAPGDRQSELGYMIEHPAAFTGTAYPRLGPASFGVHRAHFDFNLLTVNDPYRPPTPAEDQRHQPSAQRQSALFDWWERIWDYALLRKQTRVARERPAWLLFYEASERQPDDPPQLVRHLGIDVRHAPLVLSYHAVPTNHVVTTPELEDERWAVRAWQGEKWIRNLRRHFLPQWLPTARPDAWASDAPDLPSGAPAVAGNENLTAFVRNGLIENKSPRRYDDLIALNNGLRVRARDALVAYLCGMDRVVLPWGGYAQAARDLSALLLQDVEVGTCQRASRIEEACSAVHQFIQRARLGLEPSLPVTAALALLWDSQFIEYRRWEACKRRWIHRENWIGWDEAAKARKTEAFRFLEQELRRATLTIPVPGGAQYWQGPRPPRHPGLTLLQNREPSGIQLLPPTPEPEGLDLLGAPERDARPSWLAPLFRGRPGIRGDGNDGGNNGDDNGDGNPDIPGAGPNDPQQPNQPNGPRVTAATLPVPLERLPLWVQAAIRLGTRFVRIAAAAIPPASAAFTPRIQDAAGTCCKDCGCAHPPLMDEYYFWLQDARHYSSDGVIQDAEQGSGTDEMQSDWHRPEKLPELLHWESAPSVHLFWCRVHNGEFKQPRRSDHALRIDPALLAPGAQPQLDFMGRSGDSLRFEISGALVPLGYGDTTPPGFRYDMATDSAIALPLIAAPPATNVSIGGLPAYPYFAYFAPGAPLLPASMFAESVAVAGALRAHCRFEAALKWYELAFNPLLGDSHWAQCPPRSTVPPGIPGTPNPNDPNNPNNPNNPNATPAVAAAAARGGDVTCCPTAPVEDAIARNRAIALEYLETLLQWADALLCRHTPEAFQRATVILDVLRRVLGETPPTLFARDDETAQPLSTFQPRPAPLNPRLMSLYERSADRLALIHHCLNGKRLRNGRPNIDMPYFGNSTMLDGWRTGTAPCNDDEECLSCCNAYRFTLLIEKSLELAGEVRGFGAALLAAYEKGDAEYLASLRATQERQLLHLALQARQDQWREADWQVQSLQKSKEHAQTRLRYYQNLLANGLNSGEIGYQVLSGVSMGMRFAGNVSETIAQSMGVVPDMWMGVAGIAGTPLFFQQFPVGSKAAGSFATAARIMTSLAEHGITSAGLSSTQGGWDRREEEWRHQVEIIGIEIEQIERQILAAERRRAIALGELNSHQRQIEHAVEVQNFLRDKFTSHELYLHMQQETAALHRQLFDIAHDAARRAQHAFNLERGVAKDFLPACDWDNLHEALHAGDRLHVALRQMEKAYLSANCREYELTKHISLRSHFPAAFLQLKTTGYCEIEIPEWLLDLDFPGHYLRRIKNVRVTIPCVVGPYTGIHCRLTLLSSQTRIDPRLIEAPLCCCDEPDCADRYRPLPDDARIRKAYAASEAIATSSGQNDAGLFELNFRDERYLPFEFAGAVSRWRIELPQENNQWPLETLGDYVLELNYTAREGGEVLRRAANKNAQRHLPGDGVRLFDLQQELPDAWQALQAPQRHGHRDVALKLGRTLFPFLPARRPLTITRLELFVESPAAAPSASRQVEFRFEPPQGCEEDCGPERRFIDCVASAQWPGLFHGVLDLPGLPVAESRSEWGTLRLQPDFTTIGRVFLLLSYTTLEHGAAREEQCLGFVAVE